MKLDKIKQQFSRWAANPSSGRLKIQLDALASFQEHWNPGHPDYLAMFGRSIDEKYLELYQRERKWPVREVILKMIQKNPEGVKQLFLDLFYDRVHLRSRVDHFKEECEGLFKPVTQEVGNRFKHHFHDDFELISMYLQLHQPDRYVQISYDRLLSFLQFVEARNLPDRRDYEGQIKGIRTINTLALREEVIGQALKDVGLPIKALDSTLLLGENIIYSSSLQ